MTNNRNLTAHLEVPHVVKTMKIGNTTIRIADNYCRNTTPEEVEAILNRIARMVQPILSAQAAAEEAAKI